MKNFVITVISKNRVFKETFTLLNVLKKYNIFVYVDEQEQDAYKEVYPKYNIVPHTFKTINEIRGFIQKHQHDLGNDMLMFDDDIHFFMNEECFIRPLNEVIETTIPEFKKYDFLYFKHKGDTFKQYFQIGASVVGLSLRLYDKGIVYKNNATFEDTDFHLTLTLKNVPSKLLPYRIIKNDDINLSSFGTEWYQRALITLYQKYGDIIYLVLDNDTLDYGILIEKFDDFKKYGACFDSKENKAVLENIKINKFYGHDLITSEMLE
jgi:hypothetical protein